MTPPNLVWKASGLKWIHDNELSYQHYLVSIKSLTNLMEVQC